MSEKTIHALAVQPETRSIELAPLPAPELRADDQVLLRPIAVGLCGTDRSIARFRDGRAPRESPWLVLGHEALCQVERTGAGVHGLSRGDWVVPLVRRPCPDPACTPCRSGRQDFCRTGRFEERGIDGAPGFAAELAVDEARHLVRVPPAAREHAVLTEPLTIAEKALDQIDLVQRRLPWGPARGERHRALVLGAGPVGLLGALRLLDADFETTVYSRGSEDSAGARWARAVGAHYVRSAATPPGELARTAGEADVVYEATGAVEFPLAVLEHALAANGVFVFTGLPDRDETVELRAGPLITDLVQRNQIALGTVNASREDYVRAIGRLGAFERRWPGALEQLVTDRWELADWRRALERRPGSLKQVLQPAVPIPG